MLYSRKIFRYPNIIILQNELPLYFLLGGKGCNSIRVIWFFNFVSSSCDLRFLLALTIVSLSIEFLPQLTFIDLDSSLWCNLELVDIVSTIQVVGKSAWLNSISDINGVLIRYYIFHFHFRWAKSQYSNRNTIFYQF